MSRAGGGDVHISRAPSQSVGYGFATGATRTLSHLLLLCFFGFFFVNLILYFALFICLWHPIAIHAAEQRLPSLGTRFMSFRDFLKTLFDNLSPSVGAAEMRDVPLTTPNPTPTATPSPTLAPCVFPSSSTLF